MTFFAYLAPEVDGTLNGRDTSNVTLTVDSNQTLECDMLPIGVASGFDGVWEARVHGQVTSILSVNMTSGRAILAPPSGSDVYTDPGNVLVECIYKAPDGTPVYQFNRTVEIQGKCNYWIDHSLTHVPNLVVLLL